MLEINTEVDRGILFIRLNGILNQTNFKTFGLKINSLLYKYGFQYFVFDFTNIVSLDENIFLRIQNKLIEIFLNCGKVVISGMSELSKKKIGFTKDRLFYVDSNIDAFKYFCL